MCYNSGSLNPSISSVQEHQDNRLGLRRACCGEVTVPHTPRIGIQIWPDDPFWVQVQEAIQQHAQERAAELVTLLIENLDQPSDEEIIALTEEVLAQDLDALIGWNLSERFAARLLEAGLPIVCLTETDLRHTRLVSPLGLYAIARQLGAFLAEQLPADARVASIGGAPGEEHGRLIGAREALAVHPSLSLVHVPSAWRYEHAYPQISEALQQFGSRFDAIFGFSDSLALAARDAGRALGLVDERTLIVGINGDPLALAAIAEGGMTATMQTPAADLGLQAIELATRAAQGLALPEHFSFKPQLVTAENVTEIAARQLFAMAALPSRLVGFNRRQEQQRLVQLETSLEINRRAGLILDRQRLAYVIAELIRTNYAYDQAQLFLWDSRTQTLALEQPDQSTAPSICYRLDEAPILRAALERNEPIFIPDVRHSHRFAPDPYHPATRSRVVVPIRLGGQVTGLLDLHSYYSTHHTHQQLISLQTLADQLGIALHNAELYGEAVQARAAAEKADRLKTALLANVSHELRTPLTVIIGYSQAAIGRLNVDTARDAKLAQDVTQIQHSGEHLLRLINDLLDLSRAEINELELLPESIDTRGFLEDIFRSNADLFGAGGAVTWRLELSPDLPTIDADPVRLRQVLLNLLHNAHKFTKSGEITLGAEIAAHELHIWVADTGAGIPKQLREQIFEPFVSIGEDARQREGIGLGLSISRRLVALHGGRMLLESQPDHGSTFHIYLPQPTHDVAAAPSHAGDERAMLLVSEAPAPPAQLVDLAERRGLALRQLRPGDDPANLLTTVRPALLAWDLTTAAASGLRAVEQIRSHPRLGRLPMMLYHGDAAATRGAATATTGLLLKPLGENALIDALRDLDPDQPDGSILIVDDDPQTRALHRRIIAEHFPGYTIRAVGDGRAALDMLARETPSLIVLDLAMPEVDGVAVLETLRANSRTAAVPVLVLSDRTLAPADVRRLGEARVIFQTKDVLSEEELARSLRRTLGRDEPLPPHTSALVKRAIAFIQQHYTEQLSRQEIADAVGVSKDYLGRIFHQELGLAPWDYLIRYRVLRAKELLQTTSYSIADVATRVGFDTATYFSHIFHREVGCSPRIFRVRH
jgi:signal transduction histidine kinase/AraC-like DNA-binding protein/ActR/RegA family two-component response regulator